MWIDTRHILGTANDHYGSDFDSKKCTPERYASPVDLEAVKIAENAVLIRLGWHHRLG